MATTYERLIAAGAPELPSSFFYRIKERGAGLDLEIRERGAYGGSVRRASGYVLITPGKTPLAGLVSLAKALRRNLDDYLEREATRAEGRELLGDYGPNR